MFNFKPGRRSRQRPSVQDVLVNWVNDKGKGKGEKKGGKVAEAAEGRVYVRITCHTTYILIFFVV